MRRLLALALLPFAGPLPAGEAARADAARPRELNLWPLIVERHPPGAATQEMQALGPLFFARDGGPGSGTESGWRPLFTQATAPGGQRHETHLLFPLAATAVRLLAPGPRPSANWTSTPSGSSAPPPNPT